MIKKYNEYINENLLKGVSKENLSKQLEGLSNNERIRMCIKYKFFDLLPRGEDGVCVYDDDYLDCSYSNLTTLPDNLSINGIYLDCSGNELISLPDNLSADCGLYCSDNKLITLPDNFSVGGYLDCRNNELISLPNNLTINGYFDCSFNQLTTLPDNLTVNGDLRCNSQKTGIILELPKDAVVKGVFNN